MTQNTIHGPNSFFVGVHIRVKPKDMDNGMTRNLATTNLKLKRLRPSDSTDGRQFARHGRPLYEKKAVIEVKAGALAA